MKKILVSLLLVAGFSHATDSNTIDVYRDPDCGCCVDWIDHLTENGFTVHDHVKMDMRSVKQELGVPMELASCHTGVMEGKFIEGHVPAADILEMRKRPDLIGLAVPGMPIGSPGMEMGDRKDAYKVIGLSQDGKLEEFNSYP